MKKNSAVQVKGDSHRVPILTRLKRDWQVYVLLLPGILYFIIFHYIPLYGIQIAFKDFKVSLGITGSPWIGFENFTTFFQSYLFSRLISNTLLLNLFDLLWGFPIPIILALMLNRIRQERFKKFTQTVIYIPHFISTVVMAGMLYIFLSPSSGIINQLIQFLGGESIYFMAEAKWFRTVYIASGIWQSAGWNTILYIAALTSVDTELYEAATLDGANILQKIRHIDLPSVLPIAVMMLILNCGKIMGGDTQKALLLQTSANLTNSEIIGTYVYSVGLGQAKYSYTAAIGLFQNVIGFIMIMTVNSVSKKLSSVGLF